MPTCWIIAGPNGAGKTTFALEFLPEVAPGARFINADSIAAGLSPLDPSTELARASRIFLDEIDEAISARKDFAFETTLSGLGHLKRIQKRMQSCWRVELVYLALPSRELSRLRVAERVAHGGHDIPLADIERRFAKGLRNLFERYGSVVSRVRCFLNSDERCSSVFVQEGTERVVLDDNIYSLLIELSRS